MMPAGNRGALLIAFISPTKLLGYTSKSMNFPFENPGKVRLQR